MVEVIGMKRLNLPGRQVFEPVHGGDRDRRTRQTESLQAVGAALRHAY
jgi:hypothetical protein